MPHVRAMPMALAQDNASTFRRRYIIHNHISPDSKLCLMCESFV